MQSLLGAFSLRRIVQRWIIVAGIMALTYYLISIGDIGFFFRFETKMCLNTEIDQLICYVHENSGKQKPLLFTTWLKI